MQNTEECQREKKITCTVIDQGNEVLGHLGGPVGGVSDFGSGHDLTVRGFKPHVRLCADSSQPGACLGFCVSLSMPFPAQALSLSLSQK